MKVRLKLEKSINKDKELVLLLEKGDSACVVNFYKFKDEVILEDWVSDLNNAFKKLWH